MLETRRRFLVAAPAVLGAGAMLAAVPRGYAAAEENKEKPVTATEDLMREHGVLRRALLVYRESATKLRRDPTSVDPRAIAQTARLFRSFGEDYHEKLLEEAHIFPVLRKAGGEAAAEVDVLIAQHARGREITDYILTVANRGSIGAGDVEPLARAFLTLDLMYENHAAHEDTVAFPAWKDALSEHQFRQMGEKFEDIEHKQFGKDGFDDAVAQITAIEKTLGFYDLAQFTAPPPPKA